MGHKPTAEQDAILSAFPSGADLVIEAGAGAGKTSTLKMLAEQNPRKRGLYLAYNRAIKDDAARTFPGAVTCMTSHGLAYRPVGSTYKARLNGGRVPARRAAQILGINQPLRLGADTLLQPASLARIVTDTVARFCHSADAELSSRHVPVINGLEDVPSRNAVAQFALPYARKAWADLNSADGQLHFTHDTYLKIYQLTNPTLDYDYLLVDEAQDLNPVVQAIIANQTGAQICLVGDRNQSIYSWRGAVDAMEHADGKRLYLSQSFRFGPAVADEANKWLEVLNADLRLTGFDAVPSVVAPLDSPDAILCRSNAAALVRVMRATERGIRVGLVGGGADIKALARAAGDLMAGRGTEHPELMAFQTWSEVQDYVDHDSAGSDLKVMVSMVDKHGADTLIRVMDQLTDERYASLLVSTAHKAKGREWNRVQIADDFREPKKSEDNPHPTIDRAEAMLAYVAVTRAKRVLDRDGLWWVDNWVRPATPASVPALPTQGVAATESGAVANADLEAPFAVGDRVTYRPTGRFLCDTVFTVVMIRSVEHGSGWICDISEPVGKVQRGVNPSRLIAAPTAGSHAPAVSPQHCGRCGRDQCWCGAAEKARWLALANGTTVAAVAAAISAGAR